MKVFYDKSKDRVVSEVESVWNSGEMVSAEVAG